MLLPVELGSLERVRTIQHDSNLLINSNQPHRAERRRVQAYWIVNDPEFATFPNFGYLRGADTILIWCEGRHTHDGRSHARQHNEQRQRRRCERHLISLSSILSCSHAGNDATPRHGTPGLPWVVIHIDCDRFYSGHVRYNSLCADARRHDNGNDATQRPYRFRCALEMPVHGRLQHGYILKCTCTCAPVRIIASAAAADKRAGAY